LHNFVVLCETNVLSLINQCLNNYYQIKTKLLQCSTVLHSTFGCPNRTSKKGLCERRREGKKGASRVAHKLHRSFSYQLGRPTMCPMRLCPLALHAYARIGFTGSWSVTLRKRVGTSRVWKGYATEQRRPCCVEKSDATVSGRNLISDNCYAVINFVYKRISPSWMKT
jgi:hypothetical protein